MRIGLEKEPTALAKSGDRRARRRDDDHPPSSSCTGRTISQMAAPSAVKRALSEQFALVGQAIGSGLQLLDLPVQAERLGQLPSDVEVVAYCRGPFGIYALKQCASCAPVDTAAPVLADGVPGWRHRGLPVEAADHTVFMKRTVA